MVQNIVSTLQDENILQYVQEQLHLMWYVDDLGRHASPYLTLGGLG